MDMKQYSIIKFHLNINSSIHFKLYGVLPSFLYRNNFWEENVSPDVTNALKLLSRKHLQISLTITTLLLGNTTKKQSSSGALRTQKFNSSVGPTACKSDTLPLCYSHLCTVKFRGNIIIFNKYQKCFRVDNNSWI